MRNKLRLVVLGLMGRIPFGGQAWHYLHFLLGLHQLGHEVYYVEDDTAWPYDPVANATVNDATYAVSHIRRVMQAVGLEQYWVYRAAYRNGECYGLSEARLKELYHTADAVLNVCGATELRDEQRTCKRLIYVETDPVTKQLEIYNGEQQTLHELSQHDLFFTYGENYGEPDCGVPLQRFIYQKTRIPIFLPAWPLDFNPSYPTFTTIANWRQTEKDIAYNGELYSWSKHLEFLKFLGLPSLTEQKFELCLSIQDQADKERLLRSGWSVSSPLPLSLNIRDYQRYIGQSRAEWTVAKDQNVRLRSGWFSDRSACYLASGKPVVTQETGFSKFLPTGEGLFAFTTMEEIVTAIDSINSNYERHCRAARAIAEDYFDAAKVLQRLLTDAGL